MQRRKLALAPEDRLGHLAGQPAVGVDQERIGAVFVEADHRGDALGEQREAAGDETGIGAVLAHGCDQRSRPRRDANPIGDDLVDDRGGQALEQRHPLAQRRREFDFAAHRTLGDGRNMRLESDIVGKLVNAFLADHGRIHVGEKEPLAAAARALQHHVDGGAGERRAHALGESARVVGLGILPARDKGNVGGDAGIEPDRRLRRRQRAARACDHGGVERRRRGI